MSSPDVPGRPTPPDASPAVPGRVTDSVVGLLERLVPAARGARTVVTVLAAASALSVLLLFIALPVTDRVQTLTSWVAHLVLTALLFGPPLLLLGLRLLLSSVIGLPDRLRREPGLRKEQVTQLAALAGGEDPRTAERGLRPGTRAWRFGKLLLEARGQLVAYSVLWRLASVPYLVLCAAAAAIAVVELFLLPVIVLTLFVTW